MRSLKLWVTCGKTGLLEAGKLELHTPATPWAIDGGKFEAAEEDTGSVAAAKVTGNHSCVRLHQIHRKNSHQAAG